METDSKKAKHQGFFVNFTFGNRKNKSKSTDEKLGVKKIINKIEGGKRTKGLTKKYQPLSPIVSVVTVVFNGERYLEETIKSVLGQRYSNIEYIIIDGGSRDSTIDIIEKYQEKIDYWVSEPDNGIYHAMNKGIELCSGDLIKLINADDRLTENSVDLAVENYNKLKDDTTDFIICGHLDIIDDKSNIIGVGDEKSLIKFFDSFLHPSWYVPVYIYEKYGPYSLQYSISSDYEYYMRLKSRGVNVNFLKFPLAQYRKNGASSGFGGVPQVYQINRIYIGVSRAVYVAALMIIIKILGIIRGLVRKA